MTRRTEHEEDRWEKWYAWHPVRIDGRWVWRRWVLREYEGCGDCGAGWYNYRLL